MKAPNGQEVKSIVIHGRRWFQRTYGNTYHSLIVQVNGERVHGYDFQYGYGSMYEQNAREWLHENGYVDLQPYPNQPHTFRKHLSEYCREHDIVYVSTVVDVDRKRDL